MLTRTVKQITSATRENVGPFAIRNILPTRNLRQIDPFLLIHHLPETAVGAGADLRIPPHPHAGFEVVTYLLQGEFYHRDSKGFEQVARAGDINWMTSAAGIVHSEGPTADFMKKGGNVELLQVWINLPAAKKNMGAGFRHFAAADFPVAKKGNVQVKVLLGSLDKQQSPIATHTPMYWYQADLPAGEALTIPVDAGYSAGLLVLDGAVKVLNESLTAGELVEFDRDGDQLAFSATQDSRVMIFGGEPINEKMVSYGPFVMNSFEEIQAKISAYEKGEFGTLSF